MKRALLLLLAVTIISQGMVYVAIGVYYHLNKQYISQQLCVNRNNPKMHCNGQCYLSKQLKKAEAGESKSAKVIKEKDAQVINQCASAALIYFPAYSRFEPVYYSTVLYSSDGADYIIKPPAA